jgi:hypothetical protein
MTDIPLPVQKAGDLLQPGEAPPGAAARYADRARMSHPEIAAKGQAQASVSGAAIDRTIAAQTNVSRQQLGRADVVVDFRNAPPRTRISHRSRGIFEDMKITQTRSMARTGAQDEVRDSAGEE